MDTMPLALSVDSFNGSDFFDFLDGMTLEEFNALDIPDLDRLLRGCRFSAESFHIVSSSPLAVDLLVSDQDFCAPMRSPSPVTAPSCLKPGMQC